MLSMTPSIALWLHLAGPDFPDGRVPADLFIRTLGALQRALWEAAAWREGEDFKPSAAFKRRYELHAVPMFASPDGLPLAVGPMQLSLDLLTGLEPDAVIERVEQVVGAIATGDMAALSEGRSRRMAADILKAMPSGRARWTLGLAFKSGTRAELDARHAKALSRALDVGGSRQEAPMTVIGELVGVDFEKGTFELLQPDAKRPLVGPYDKGLEVWLLKHRRKAIQVSGTFMVDGSGRAVQMKAVHHVMSVDMSPVALSRFEHQGRWFELIPSLTLTPELAPPLNQSFMVSEPALGLEVVAETRDELESVVKAEAVALWDRHVQGGEDAFLARAWKRRMKALASAVMEDGY
jgi:hypothetical protein